MMLNWDNQLAKFNRGNAIEAETTSDLSSLHPPMAETWDKVIEVADRFKDDGTLSILSEVWPDTGRVIFRLSDHHEFARVILSIKSLEKRYYELMSLPDEEFERKHDELVDSILNEIIVCITSDSSSQRSYLIEVVGRSSDDEDTECYLSK